MVEFVDICCGLAWGDEAKGKVVSYLSREGKYDFVCRWAGGNNAGHTIYLNNIKYKTHLIPSGIFHNIKSIIGPDCVVNIDSFFEELEYLKKNGFNTSLIKISPKAHIITDKHIEEDILKYSGLGTTSKGIAPCYRDKFGRTGVRAETINQLKDYIWDEQLYGKVLCEGAQGFWLDINYGNYPYITSSTTLPYGACCLGFPPQKIRKIYGAAKIYDTRAGTDPDFPEDLLEDPLLKQIILEGKEYGTTTGRMRKVNWLNLNKLIESINISGCTDIIISKVDVLDKLKLYKLQHKNYIHTFDNINDMKNYIIKNLHNNCPLLLNIIFSAHMEDIIMMAF
jgi:adenylosuccinate synthase